MTPERLIDLLRDPAAYPEPTSGVELLQTHISYIFLTDRHVYKVKKPVDFGFLDYTTLAKRRHFCEREVALNARLCPDVYLGVVDDPRGRRPALRLGGPGETVEYAVKMVRLPQERMLREVLRRGEGEPAIFQPHRPHPGRLPRARRDQPRDSGHEGAGGRDVQLRGELRADREVRRQLRARLETFEVHPHRDPPVSSPPRPAVRGAGAQRDGFATVTATSTWTRSASPIRSASSTASSSTSGFATRTWPRRWRSWPWTWSSRVSTSFAQVFVDAYVEASGDGELRELLDFYRAYRAYVRAKVSSFATDDPTFPDGAGTSGGTALHATTSWPSATRRVATRNGS